MGYILHITVTSVPADDLAHDLAFKDDQMLRIYCALLEIFAILPWVAQMGARKGVNLESRRKRILTVVPHAVNDVNDVVLNGSIARDRAIC